MQGYTTAGANALQALLAERLVFLDGAMGTMLQGLGLTEADFRGDLLRELVSACRDLSRAGADARRGRRRSTAARDELRHAQHEGRHLRHPLLLRRERRAAAAGAVGDDHRCLRADALRADGRGDL